MRTCELCSSRASVYCCADKAFVCWECDAKVHGANFIVARHARLILCHSCSGAGVVWSGRCVESRRYICPNCSFTDSGSREAVSSSHGSAQSTTDLQEDDDDSDEEVSSTKRGLQLGSRRTSRSRSPDSVLRPNRELGQRLAAVKASQLQVNVTPEERLETILRRWTRSLGLANADDRLVPRSIHLLRRVSWLLKSKRFNERLDARAALAACLWAAIKLEAGLEASELLPPQLERCTGVPVRVLVAVEAKLRAALSSSSSASAAASSSSSSLSTSDSNHRQR